MMYPRGKRCMHTDVNEQTLIRGAHFTVSDSVRQFELASGAKESSINLLCMHAKPVQPSCSFDGQWA